MKIWVVTGNWATENDCDSFIKLFSTYEKARECFESCIYDEQQSDWFKETPDMIIDDQSPDFWCAYQDGDYLLNHSQYAISEMEVN